jgi:hypothetical protein
LKLRAYIRFKIGEGEGGRNMAKRLSQAEKVWRAGFRSGYDYAKGRGGHNALKRFHKRR